jgi:hypothetical protein
MFDTVKISIIGQSLSSPSICVIPDYSAMLVSPYITFECDGKKYKKEFVTQLGGGLEHISNSDLISAPFETHMANPCKGSESQITVGWDTLVLTSFSQGVKMIPDQPMTIHDTERNP